MNSSNIDINFHDMSDNRLNKNIACPQLQKYYSSLEKRRADFGSNPHNSRNNISANAEFKLIYLLNNLSKMSLDMNKCYILLETINLDDDIEIDALLSIFLNRYFSEGRNQEVNDEKNAIMARKVSAANRIMTKIFDKKPKPAEIIPEKSHVNMNNINKNIVIQINNSEKNIKNTKQCNICYHHKNLSEYIDGIPHEFCYNCLHSYIKQKILSNQILEIKCPDECGLIFENKEISLILSKDLELYNKYKKFKKIAVLSQDPNLRWCIKAECRGYMIGDLSSKKLTCAICQTSMCFLCRNAWHDGQSCEQAMNSEFKRYVDKVQAKECPKCRSKIEKYEGCNHMTCPRCHYQFCWICLGEYSLRHFQWYNILGCPNMQYSEDLPPSTCAWLFKCSRFMLYLLIFLLAAVVSLAIFPIFVIVIAIYSPYSMFYHKWQPNDLDVCDGCIYATVFTIGVIILLPIEIILAIIPGSCFVACYILTPDDS